MKCSNKLKKQSENKNQENKQKPKFLSTLKETCDQSSVSRLILILITTNDFTNSISITVIPRKSTHWFKNTRKYKKISYNYKFSEKSAKFCTKYNT